MAVPFLVMATEPLLMDRPLLKLPLMVPVIRPLLPKPEESSASLKP